MVQSWLSTLSLFDLIISIGLGVGTTAIAFLVASYYWGLDHQSNQFDEEIRGQIEDQPALNGLERSVDTKLIATSNDNTSRAISKIQQLRGLRSDNPDTIFVFDSDDITQRKIELVRERTRDIPGKTILNRDLIASIRAYYAYRLSLATEDIQSPITAHFKKELEEYEFSDQVMALGKAEHYETVMLDDVDGDIEDKNALNDVFLKMVTAVEESYVGESESIEETEELVEECKQVLVPFFLGLRYGKILGTVANGDFDNGEYVHKYQIDIRDNDNWGYWLLTEGECSESEFKAVRHLCWKVDELVENRWEDEKFNKIHPEADRLTNMEFVQNPFIILQKEEKIFRGGGSSGQS